MVRKAIWLLLLASIGVSAQVRNQKIVEIYHGHESAQLLAIPYTKPPYVHFEQFLNSLGVQAEEVGEDAVRLRINERDLYLDRKAQLARFKRQSFNLPMRQKDGAWYARVDGLCEVFSKALGRDMIYEPTSRSLHVPKSRDLSASPRIRPIDNGYQIIIAWSRSLEAPTVTQAGRNLILKIQENNIHWDRSGFVTNDAVTGIELFENLPDNSTEVLFKIGKKTKRFNVEPFDPGNPRTIIKLTGDFETAAEELVEVTDADHVGIRRIVVDPGHGGRDKGAQGPSGLAEKDVTLELARLLTKRLQADERYEAHLTRDDDTLVSLKRRTGIANNLKADLFLSIHVNAIKSQSATGSETYYLSMDAADAGGYDQGHYTDLDDSEDEMQLGSVEDDLGMMLWDMAQTKHTEDSLRVARYIQEELNLLAGIRSRGVKQAPLKVLKGAMMPAILIEVAFISNRVEEEKLRNPLFKSKIVEAIANAVEHYDDDVRKRAAGKQQAPAPKANAEAAELPEEGRD